MVRRERLRVEFGFELGQGGARVKQKRMKRWKRSRLFGEQVSTRSGLQLHFPYETVVVLITFSVTLLTDYTILPPYPHSAPALRPILILDRDPERRPQARRRRRRRRRPRTVTHLDHVRLISTTPAVTSDTDGVLSDLARRASLDESSLLFPFFLTSTSTSTSTTTSTTVWLNNSAGPP